MAVQQAAENSFQATFHYQKKKYYIGNFPTREEAEEAIKVSKIALLNGEEPPNYRRMNRLAKRNTMGITPEEKENLKQKHKVSVRKRKKKIGASRSIIPQKIKIPEEYKQYLKPEKGFTGKWVIEIDGQIQGQYILSYAIEFLNERFKNSSS